MDADALQQQLAELMAVVKEEQALRAQAKARQAEANTEHQATEEQLKKDTMGHPVDPASQKGPKISVPGKFDGTLGIKAEVCASQVGLYVISNPTYFPDDRSKVVFSISYLTRQASNWAQPFTQKLFDGEDITYNSFTWAFQCMYLKNSNINHIKFTTFSFIQIHSPKKKKKKVFSLYQSL
ncbi:hypothetical protein PCANC_25870 [Puccinia coronata f. sp. avenae]|uniref:DUF4939 domain-containing protein n=1 Tax=Puccinia coronata f. sp. avenae TaxID=200324 RepID=A0A2N5S6X9_9BASI|nr:hypothetical protein PCASD_25381 [Puccinia coronata f. sp. avenae]PLW25992.1 hypothetical protein PCANC_25870 [Puccinia coronata f. sp. avenae]PLW36016.1 hypothetical protein PCASD_13789 [Puccinia coronata f. sp. avenae]